MLTNPAQPTGTRRTRVIAAAAVSTEIFGPVAPVIPFDDEAEAVRLANDTEWGLVGYVFTRDVDRAFRLGEALEVGMVGVNTGLVSNPAAPLGGVKQSGSGRERRTDGDRVQVPRHSAFLTTPGRGRSGRECGHELGRRARWEGGVQDLDAVHQPGRHQRHAARQ